MFTIPNEDDATYEAQARVSSVDLQALATGFSRTGVVSGMAVSVSTGRDFDISSGAYEINGSPISSVAKTGTIGAGDATHPRIDIVSVDGDGSVRIAAGTPAADPVAPNVVLDRVVLASIYVPAGMATLLPDMISDRRVFLVNAEVIGEHESRLDTAEADIAGKQAADADLTAIAALAPADDALIQRKAGAWTSRTPAQVKADMSIGVGDVSGLDENTRDVIGAALVAGSGVAVTVDDPGNTITIAVSGVVADAINDGTTTVAPSQNAVFDALASKANRASSRLIRLPSPGRLSVSGGMVGGLLVPVVGTSTHALPVGNQFLGRCHHSGQTAVWLGFNISANALTSGQSIIVSVYEDAADYGPGLLYSSQSLVIGAATGDQIFSSGVSLAFPVGPCYVSILNPLTNAGTITIRAGTFYEPHFGVVQNGTWGGPMKRTGITTPASDLSAIQLRSSIGTAEIQLDAGTTFPVLLARTA